MYSPQRETAGSRTKRKYKYQYIWALYKVLKSYNPNDEFAIFIEYHEDVVIATGLHSETVVFSFNQVKTSSRRFTINKLCSRKKGKDKSEASILGKLLASVLSKRYQSRIRDVTIVCTAGFGFSYSNEYEKRKLNFKAIEVRDYSEIENRICEELKIKELPTNLFFETPVLSENLTDETVIGHLSELIEKMYPNRFFKANTIYRILMDELFRKGEVVEQFPVWNDALRYKALTSVTINKVISDHIASDLKYDRIDDSMLKELCEKIGLNLVDRIKMKNSYVNYKHRLQYTNDENFIKVSNEIIETVKRNLDEMELREIIDTISYRVHAEHSNYFPTLNDAIAFTLLNVLLI